MSTSAIARAIFRTGTAASPAAPNLRRQPPVCIADILDRHLTCIRSRHFLPLGKVLCIALGISDDSAYFQEEVRKKLAPISQLQGLMLHWTQETAPMIAGLQDGLQGHSSQFVFPQGIERFPKIADPRFRKMHVEDDAQPLMRQDVDYYSSGLVIGRGGEKFYCLQPVEQLAVWLFGAPSLRLITAKTNPWNGTKTAFLYSPTKKMGYLVHGMLEVG
jgi:hypothetical protein